MNLTGKTEKGLRKQNEDSYLVCDDGSRRIVAVSDGMGGHAAGEVASRISVVTLQSVLKEADRIDASVLRRAFSAANEAVYDAAGRDASLHGMGATLVCAVLEPDSFIAANVGDSRLYHYHSGELTQVSHDHSFVAELVRRNLITREEAKNHPRRNLITRAIGTDSSVKVDLFPCEWEENDILLLCSDGLSGSVDEKEICDVLETMSSLEDGCSRLIDLAIRNGSSDNITVVLAQNSEDLR